MSSELILAIILTILVVGSMAVMAMNHKNDSVEDTRPTASVLTYWDTDRVRYRWVTHSRLSEGFEGFTTREDAKNNAEWNGYRVI